MIIFEEVHIRRKAESMAVWGEAYSEFGYKVHSIAGRERV